MGYCGTLKGLKLYANPILTKRKQVIFPRSKRRRIQKKWAKRDSNFLSYPDPDCYILADGNALVAHPVTIDALKRAAEQDNQDR